MLRNLADRYCSHPKPVQFKSFDEGDWAAYNGCESETPRVFYSEAITVVIDGRALSVELPQLPEEPGGWRDIFADEFADEDEAEAVAQFLVANPGLTPKLLGEPVGQG